MSCCEHWKPTITPSALPQSLQGLRKDKPLFLAASFPQDSFLFLPQSNVFHSWTGKHVAAMRVPWRQISVSHSFL